MASAAATGAGEDAGPALTSELFFREQQMEGLATTVTVQSMMLNEKSEYQTVQVLGTGPWGRVLVLDGKTQSTERDEFIYHESLVHPAMLQCSTPPKTVYIGGGGEMATAREVLRHPSVEKVVMVDLDKLVVDVSLRDLPEWGDGCMEDPRLEVHYEDAHAFLKNYEGTFDVIVMDIADPIEAGPGYVLYTDEFYRFARTKLNQGGVLVTQSGPGSVHNHQECFTAIASTLRQSFACVASYTVDIPSFGSNWAFNMAFSPRAEDADGSSSGTSDDVEATRRAALRPVEETDALIASRGLADKLRHYDGLAHIGMFGLPKYLRKALQDDTRVITVENPVFMY